MQPEIPKGGVDVFACTRQVAGELVRMDESHTSLVGLVYWLGFRRLEVPYDRLPRPEGQSAWSFRRKVRYLLDSIFSFTDLPITLIIALGVLGVVVSTVAGIAVLVAWATDQIDVAGYTPLILSVFFMSSLIIIALGIVGLVRVAHVREQQGPARRRFDVPRTVRRWRGLTGDSRPAAPLRSARRRQHRRHGGGLLSAGARAAGERRVHDRLRGRDRVRRADDAAVRVPLGGLVVAEGSPSQPGTSASTSSGSGSSPCSRGWMRRASWS